MTEISHAAFDPREPFAQPPIDGQTLDARLSVPNPNHDLGHNLPVLDAWIHETYGGVDVPETVQALQLARAGLEDLVARGVPTGGLVVVEQPLEIWDSLEPVRRMLDVALGIPLGEERQAHVLRDDHYESGGSDLYGIEVVTGGQVNPNWPVLMVSMPTPEGGLRRTGVRLMRRTVLLGWDAGQAPHALQAVNQYSGIEHARAQGMLTSEELKASEGELTHLLDEGRANRATAPTYFHLRDLLHGVRKSMVSRGRRQPRQGPATAANGVHIDPDTP
jgi:hypothetical protein